MLQQYVVWIAIACGIVAILYGIISTAWIMKQPAGNARMQEIAHAIQVGAKAYLNRQYSFIAIAGVVLFLLIGFLIAWPTAIGFAVGAILSG
ncbi:MAG: sodium/proton-translocating pyrophosphatase, partial [Rhodanobacteraceae bacterium]